MPTPSGDDTDGHGMRRAGRRPAVDVRTMGHEDRDEVIAVTARAFWDDPVFGHFCRSPLHQHRFLATLFGFFLGELWAADAVTEVADHDGHPRALACWLRPGTAYRPSARSAGRLARLGPSLLGGRHHAQALRLLAAIDRAHPKDPHWYLALLATDPGSQGRGLGSALLRPVLERCDADGLPAYLETQTRSNVSWYARFDFRVEREIRVSGPPLVWCLRRPPRD